jgi:hypothetical protein
MPCLELGFFQQCIMTIEHPTITVMDGHHFCLQPCNLINDNEVLNKSIDMCCNLSLGFVTKARACKGANQEWARESHFMLLGMQESVREWTPTLPNEFPLWELESQRTSKFLKGEYRVKIHWIEKFFISLKRSWNVDLWNGLAWPIWVLHT